MEDKKAGEIRILELFREHCPDFPSGVLKAGESPDFIVVLDHRNRIGVEITRLRRARGHTEPYSRENITECLQAKEDKLKLYRRNKLRELWLILVDTDPVPGPRYSLHNKLGAWKFETGYDRVFIFSTFIGTVYELGKT